MSCVWALLNIVKRHCVLFVFSGEGRSVIYIWRYVKVMFAWRLLLVYVMIPAVHREVGRFKWNSHMIQKQRYVFTRWCSKTFYVVFQRNTDWKHFSFLAALLHTDTTFFARTLVLPHTGFHDFRILWIIGNWAGRSAITMTCLKEVSLSVLTKI